MEKKEIRKNIFIVSMSCLVGVALICFTLLFTAPIEVSGEIECSGLLNADMNKTNESLEIKNIDLTDCRVKFDSKLSLGTFGLIARN